MARTFGMRNPGERYAPQAAARHRGATLRRLAAYVLRHYRFSLVAVVLCVIVTSVTTLASTLFTRTLIDDHIVPLTQTATPDYSQLAQTLFTLAAVLLVGVACSYAYNRIMIRVSQGTMLRLRRDMFSHLQQLPISFFDTHSHGAVMSNFTNDVDTLRQVIGNSLPQALHSLITLVITFASMVVLSVPLTIVSVVMAAVMAWATSYLGSRSRRHFRQQQEHLAAVNGFIEEMMGGQRVVKVFCHEQQAIDQFEQINEALRDSACSANKTANIVMPVNGNLGNLGYVLIAVVGATLALTTHSALTLGTLVAFLTLNKNFSQPIAHISQQINSILNASAGAERVFDLMDEPTEHDDGQTTLCYVTTDNEGQMNECDSPTEQWAWRRPDGSLVKVEGGIEFDMVDFGYTADKQVLYDIVLHAMPDQKIAFVGGTGAGKTTIINLINHFFSIDILKMQDYFH